VSPSAGRSNYGVNKNFKAWFGNTYTYKKIKAIKGIGEKRLVYKEAMNG